MQLEPRNAEAALLREEIERAVAEREVGERLATARQLVGSRQSGEAKHSVEQALEIWPNEPAALELRASIQQAEQEYNAVLNEKRRAKRRAERAISYCDPARALEAIRHALDLDSQAPEPSDRTSDLLNLSNRILSASDDAQRSLERTRELCRSGDLDAALGCCDGALRRLPGHTGLRALKLDIEEVQRKRAADLIAATEREIEAEPDLDRRIELLKSASERFSHTGHFAVTCRAARQKCDFAESLAADALAAEQEHRPADVLEACPTGGSAILRAGYFRWSISARHVGEGVGHGAAAKQFRSGCKQSIGLSSAETEPTADGGIALAEKTSSNAATPFTPRAKNRSPFLAVRCWPRVNSVLLTFIGGTVAIGILLAILLPRRHAPRNKRPSFRDLQALRSFCQQKSIAGGQL